jgi:hypothetical protein
MSEKYIATSPDMPVSNIAGDPFHRGDVELAEVRRHRVQEGV